MPSKLALNYQQSSKSVSAAFKTHGPLIAAALIEKLKPTLRDGETMPDVELFLALLDRLEDRDMALFLAADQSLDTERIQDDLARTRRNNAFSTLRTTVVTLSEDVGYIFGPAARKQFHLSGVTPKDPATLLEQAERAAAALSATTSTAADAPKLPPPSRPNIPFDAATRAQQLLTHCAEFSATLAALSTDERETEAALLDRDDTAWDQNRTFTRTSTIFEQCCELVGEDKLAARIRHTTRKPGNTIEDPTE